MNGMVSLYGRELYISFDEEKPKYCEEALEVYKTKPSFVVFDLLQIISSSPENIDRKSHWKFSFTKDAKNPVLLEFDSFDGIKKAASPQFLLAMLIKQQVKVITAKIGTKPKQMSYCFFEREKKVADKIIDAIREAFIMLKIENVLLDGFK
uniref:Uncharacterized protein n=1 Tax=Panagrolaimus superbus TaxID=310955 RepID=A0A914Y3T3_9BILA